MPLGSGDRLGPYVVDAAIGAGGMGEVYRATDTDLKRPVAIKVLPDTLADDAERLARFQREAEVLARLNHPNISQIHGLERSGGTIALVMELVEGPTLADRIAQGAVPVDEVLAIAKQIADALEAAHEQGIVHRDLKPANIKVRDDGTVKVLDFGLAKALEPDGALGAANSSTSPTVTSPARTQRGLVLGTAAYMAPEQARGRAVDRRADIWAFGVVLYEMLSGRRAFEGEDISDTLSNVLKVEPDWNALPGPVPQRVRRVLQACLQKNPGQRLDSAQDVRLALDGAFETTVSTAPASVSKRRGRTLMAVGATAVVVGGLLAVAVMWSARTGSPSRAPVQRLSVMAPANRPVRLGWYPGRSLALSPDGTELAYVATKTDVPAGQPRTGLELRSLSTREVRDLTGTAGARQPFFSPDGQWVGFFTADGSLKKVSLAGGNPITVADGINGSAWTFGVWLDDGTIVFSFLSGLRRVSASGGPVTDLTTAPEDTAHWFAALVPSTRAVLFTVSTNPASGRIEALRLDTGERHVVVNDAAVPLLLSGEYLLFQRLDTTLVVAPFDVRSLTISGPAVPFTEDVRPDSPLSFLPLAELAVSRNGTLAYLPAEADAAGTLGLVDRDGTFRPLGAPPGLISDPRVSPDGRALAFTETMGGDSRVRVYDLTRGSITTRGREDAISGPAVWQPGTGALAVGGRKGDTAGVFLDGPDGSEQLIVRAPGLSQVRNLAWSPDGTQLAYTLQTGSLHDIWVWTRGGTAAEEPLLDGPAWEYGPAFSPDGRWLAYVSNESGRSEVYVRRYPQGERLVVSTDGGISPVWRRDGKELFFADPSDRKMMAVSVTLAGASLQLGKPVALFDLEVSGPSGEIDTYDVGSNTGTGYDVLPDGRFVMVRQASQSTAREIVLVQNWLDELKRLAPTK